MTLHPILRTPSDAIASACASSSVVAQTVEATLALYERRGFVEPWIGYLAEQDGRFVGGCGFAAPAQQGEAEIAYFTFPGHEGRGVATHMARALLALARPSAEGVAFIAHTLPQDGPSTTILRKLGFECLGAIEHPEDGTIWKWRELVTP